MYYFLPVKSAITHCYILSVTVLVNCDKLQHSPRKKKKQEATRKKKNPSVEVFQVQMTAKFGISK